jgi:phosphoribosylformylglycinamidine synthase
MSESQERMAAVVTPDNLEAFLAICAKWDVDCAVIGEVTGTGRLVIEWHGEVIVDVPPRTVAHDGPVYERPYARPSWQDALQGDAPDSLARPASAEEVRETVLRMVASPNLAAKTWVTQQYDRYVLGNTVLAQPENAGVVRVDEESGLGVALSTDCNGRFAKLDPYNGAKLALAEAYRNVAATGAAPLAVTNCLNFGSPEDPDVMWQFSQAVTGLADGCLELGIPVTGGNVSFYNQTGDVAIHPTPVVGVLGVIDDVERRTPMAFTGAGDVVLLLGETRDEVAGSEWAHVVHGHLGGLPPRVDLELERSLGALLVHASRESLVTAAHDVSDGGVAQVLVEMALRAGSGATVSVPEGVDPFVLLFSESTARAVVAVSADQLVAFSAAAASHGVPVTALGEVTGSGELVVRSAYDGAAEWTLDELRTASEATLPALFG